MIELRGRLYSLYSESFFVYDVLVFLYILALLSLQFYISDLLFFALLFFTFLIEEFFLKYKNSRLFFYKVFYLSILGVFILKLFYISPVKYILGILVALFINVGFFKWFRFKLANPFFIGLLFGVKGFPLWRYDGSWVLYLFIAFIIIVGIWKNYFDLFTFFIFGIISLLFKDFSLLVLGVLVNIKEYSPMRGSMDLYRIFFTVLAFLSFRFWLGFYSELSLLLSCTLSLGIFNSFDQTFFQPILRSRRLQ